MALVFAFEARPDRQKPGNGSAASRSSSPTGRGEPAGASLGFAYLCAMPRKRRTETGFHLVRAGSLRVPSSEAHVPL
jgi:hypothetical protein